MCCAEPADKAECTWWTWWWQAGLAPGRCQPEVTTHVSAKPGLRPGKVGRGMEGKGGGGWEGGRRLNTV